jgi:hypothetical protein
MTNQEKNILWWSVIGGIALFVVLIGIARAQMFDCIIPGPTGTCTLPGPAELPRTVPTTVTPTIRAVSVPAGTNIQTAVNAAQCGDFLSFSAATWPGLTLPMLNCDPQRWIVIDLGGGKIVLSASNATVKGGTFVRLQNGEITRSDTVGVVYNLISPGAGAHDLVFDNLYVHGTPLTETTRGIDLANVPNVAIINSRITEIHCLAVSGACGDAQAIAGGFSVTAQDGNYLIQNNYLQASGENILFGGGAATYLPSDITITGNTFIKPDSWNPSDPSYAPITGSDGKPHPWIVKNLFELKSANRVLVENNRMIGSWGGFSQVGFGILITPKNPSSSLGTNICPVCAVTNVTIRKNHVSKTGLAMQISFAASDNGGYPADGGRWSIHDNIFDGLQYTTCYACNNYLNQLSTGVSPTGVVLHDVSVVNNTFSVDGMWKQKYQIGLIVGAPVGRPMVNIHWDNNLFPQGNLPMLGTGGGAANCGYQIGKPTDFLKRCFDAASTITGNGVIVRGWTPGSWPVGNVFITAGASGN